jgi:hypothetical protein
MSCLNPSRNPAARTRASRFRACRGAASARSRILILLAGLLATCVTQAEDMAAASAPRAIPWKEIGSKAGADYKGDGLAVTPTESGARLHCVFQRLDGEATADGLWLTSTFTNAVSDRFRVTAMEVGRVADGPLTPSDGGKRVADRPGEGQLPCTGSVSIRSQTVRFSRPGLTEEYSVSMDGVRQDFIVEQAPASPPGGELVVKLAVSGARVEPAADGARLVLTHSGRKIAYSRLRVTDATGKELPARIEVSSVGDEATSFDSWLLFDKDVEEPSLLTPVPAREELAVVVNDADAVYPVRIDPTFSDANWVSMGDFAGTDGEVKAAVTDDSGNLYIGGTFTIAGGAYAANIAQWNGSSWSAVGSGMSEDGFVYALAVSGSTLYAGGSFTNAGGIAVNNIAQWNGSNWSALGLGMGGSSPYVGALAVSGSTLYAGGSFAMAGGSAASRVAQWNGTSWSALGSGLNGQVNALAVSGSTLYAGGEFTKSGGISGFGGGSGISATNVAQWNGTNWSALGSGISGEGGFVGPYVDALAVSGSTLYAGGDFTRAGGIAATNIAQWNGSSWSALGSGVSGVADNLIGDVYALAVSGGTLYAGGAFTSADGSPANNIAQWNGSSWSALDSGTNSVGLNNGVFALAVSGSTLYAGGVFTAAGGSAANYVAQWNGSSWSALGLGLNVGINNYVLALAVSGSTLYAGGLFQTAGGTPAANIAQWDGTNWSALGSGVNAFVFALAVSGSTLYAGGLFTTEDGSAATNIAQWNGTNWSALGPGINFTVNALAVSGSTLYAGGNFTNAGGNAANYIAQWNGSNWSALGSGMNNAVSALAVSGSTLYAGGYFTTAGGDTNANYIAQWNGSNWSALGSGMDNVVVALAVSGSTLYAGGEFTNEDGNAANYIAQWNGSSWSALGSGVNGDVEALAVSGSTLYAGGYFTTAGTNVSAYAAMANLPASIAIIPKNAAFGFTNGMFGFDVSGPSGSNVVIQTSTDLQTWIPLQTNLLGSGPLYFSDSQSPASVQRFYRALLP